MQVITIEEAYSILDLLLDVQFPVFHDCCISERHKIVITLEAVSRTMVCVEVGHTMPDVAEVTLWRRTILNSGSQRCNTTTARFKPGAFPLLIRRSID
ncbi:hypothetical protein RRG08_021294 [Elysia crispata]|uniref:Uncharacterized protein n=1 Tax=Elysia crispata TaxID=231223 RepID=A0AAE1DD64_9GAST|nr:hypothetical protein RRG08_021294 [Elysia crispata]